ncbi:hypothetical protein LTR85_012094 [Meristemomyces frigidus]|nr:hypothetical protein LTR85_012094 [Meristemomyces frigidus]
MARVTLRSNEDGSCRLLDLPPELQLVIYEMFVGDTEPMRISIPCMTTFNDSSKSSKQVHELKLLALRPWSQGGSKHRLQPALTRTCNEIRAVALPIYYQLNVFE